MRQGTVEAKAIQMSARTSGDRIWSATAVLLALFLCGYLTLASSGFIEQANLTIRYALLLSTLVAISAIIVRRHPSVATAASSVPWLSTPILASTIAYIAFCAIVATHLDDGRPLAEQKAPFLYALISWGAIRFSLGSVLPIFVLKQIGASNAFLGLTKPNRFGLPIACVWIGCAFVFVAIDVLRGTTTLPADAIEIFRNLFRAGISEEFLFRGALLGMLARRLPFGYANLIQALAFGLWHYGIDSAYVGSGNAPFVVPALMICVQVVFGYALGLVRHWTKSLAIPIVFHSIADATAII